MIPFDRTLKEIQAHANKSFPDECCGVVTRTNRVVRLENVAETPRTRFEISPVEYLRYVTDCLFVYHSHPNAGAIFSPGDKAFAERCRVPLMVISWPTGEIGMLGRVGGDQPLEGRPFIYGAFDCFSLARDFYLRELNIDVPDVIRPVYGWWDSGVLDPFYQGIQRSRMRVVTTPEYGDILIFSMEGNTVAHHIGIYLGDDRFLHHQLLHLSATAPYDKQYKNATVQVLRHVTRD